MSRPHSRFSSAPQFRINGKIRAREVRVIDGDKQLGILTLHEAIRAAQARGVDLVEVAPTATPPVCRLVDYGKWIYEKNKEDKEARKHQHASKVKEVQLSPSIDPHDFEIKFQRTVEFLTEEMKVKVVLKFRGREMMHKEIGFQVVEKLIKDVEVYGHPDADPKLAGKSIVVMLSPLPRSKRGKIAATASASTSPAVSSSNQPIVSVPSHRPLQSDEARTSTSLRNSASAFTNNPFASLNLDTGQKPSDGEATRS